MTLEEENKDLRERIAEYQLAVRTVDACCNCLKFKDRFKNLERGLAGAKCEECQKELEVCVCVKE